MYNYDMDRIMEARARTLANESGYTSDHVVYQSLFQLHYMWGVIKAEYKPDVLALIKEVERIANSAGGLTLINFVYENYSRNNGGRLNDTEVIIAAGYLINAKITDWITQCVDKALSELFGREPADDTPGNAFKHAYWNALMVEAFGEKVAKLFADAHEFGAEENLNKSNHNSMYMDLHNNALGRSLALSPIFMAYNGVEKENQLKQYIYNLTKMPKNKSPLSWLKQ